MHHLLALLLTLTLTLTAHADAPARGDFPFASLYGLYKFETCTNAGAAIWEDEHERQYIVAGHDPFDTRAMPPDYMAFALFHTPYSPIVPTWEFADLGKGRVETRDEQSGEVRTAHENYTTANGVYSRMEWNFGADNGWSTFEVTRLDERHLRYVMDRQDNLSGNFRSESCRLAKAE